MGRREDLLEAPSAACSPGFVRTTACRDIVKESGINLASIGYHYGSKDALLAQAYVAMVENMSEAFDGEIEGEPGSLRRFTSVWTNIIGTMRRPGSMWRLSMEVVAMGDQLPEVRDHLARAQRGRLARIRRPVHGRARGGRAGGGRRHTRDLLHDADDGRHGPVDLRPEVRSRGGPAHGRPASGGGGALEAVRLEGHVEQQPVLAVVQVQARELFDAGEW